MTMLKLALEARLPLIHVTTEDTVNVREVLSFLVGHFPVDPECPQVRQFHDALTEDPLTSACGAPVDEILEDWDRKHQAHCPRCREFAAANLEPRP